MEKRIKLWALLACYRFILIYTGRNFGRKWLTSRFTLGFEREHVRWAVYKNKSLRCENPAQNLQYGLHSLKSIGRAFLSYIVVTWERIKMACMRVWVISQRERVRSIRASWREIKDNMKWWKKWKIQPDSWVFSIRARVKTNQLKSSERKRINK